MKKREAQLTALLRKHLTNVRLGLGSCAIEVKVTTGNSIPFSDVQPHQLQALLNAERVLVWKIADDSRGVKPFDMFMLEKANAYVALSFLKPRTKPVVHLVPVQVWLRLQESSARKSVTEPMLALPEVKHIALPTTLQGHGAS